MGHPNRSQTMDGDSVRCRWERRVADRRARAGTRAEIRRGLGLSDDARAIARLQASGEWCCFACYHAGKAGNVEGQEPSQLGRKAH